MARQGQRVASRCCSSTSTVDFDVTWGDGRTPTLAAGRRACRCSRRSSRRPTTWRALPPPGADLARVAAHAGPRREHAGAASRRRAAREPARAAAGPHARAASARSAQSTPTASRSSVTSGGLAKQRDVDEQFAPAQFQDFGDAEKLCQPAFARHARRPRAVGRRPAAATRAALVKPRRPLRGDHHRPTAALRSHQRFPQLFVGAVRALPGRQRRRALAAVAGRRSASYVPVRRQDHGRRRRATFAVAAADDDRRASRRSPARRWRASTCMHELGGDAALHVIRACTSLPDARAGLAMSDLGTYSFLPWMRQGLAEQIAAQDGDSTVQSRDVRARPARRCRGEPVAGGAPITERRRTRDVELYGPGDVVGLDRARSSASEPRDWITNFEPNYLAARRVLRRGAAVALHAGRARPERAAAAAVDRADRARGGARRRATGVRGRAQRRRQAAALHRHRRRSRCCRPRTGCGRGRTCTSTATWRRSAGEFTSTDVAAVLRAAAERARQPTPTSRYCRLVCPRRLMRERRVPRVRRADLRDGTARGPRAGSRHGAARDRIGVGAVPRPARRRQLPIYHRWYFRQRQRAATSSTSCGCSTRGRSTSASGVRDMDVREPGHNVPGIADRRSSAGC